MGLEEFSMLLECYVYSFRSFFGLVDRVGYLPTEAACVPFQDSDGEVEDWHAGNQYKPIHCHDSTTIWYSFVLRYCDHAAPLHCPTPAKYYDATLRKSQLPIMERMKVLGRQYRYLLTRKAKVCISKPQRPLKPPPCRPHRLYQRITLRRRPQSLHTIDDIQRRDVSIIAEKQFRSFPAIESLDAPIREAHRRVESLLALERPRSRELAGEHVRPDSWVFLVRLANVDHPVGECVPVAALVAPYKGVFGP